MSKLIIVESPTKARTISRFVSKSFQILATMGHIRDLPKSKFGVEIKKRNAHFEFLPQYIADRRKSKVIKLIKQAIEKANQVYLATDPDREGEAIAYHVIAIATQKPETQNQKPENFKRISFHEITKKAIKKALQNPGEVNMDLVNAQQTRRVLDRLVGYSLSPLLWKKIRRGLSAGRVQSVAVRLIAEREREIEKFEKQKYYRIWAGFDDLVAQLVKIDNKTVEQKQTEKLFAGRHTITKTIFTNQKSAKEVVINLNDKFKIENVQIKEVSRWPMPPFITSTLQQTAARRFGWSGKQTMRVAQTLFEKGKITYHRTDSTALAGNAIEAIRKFINKQYGAKYLPSKAIFYKTKSKLAQEAHEAIRPTKFSLEPETRNLEPKEKRLYELIWRRTVACQTAPAKLAQTKIELENQTTKNKYLFATSGSQIIFDGFTKIYPIKFTEAVIPTLKKGQTLASRVFGVTQHETQAPPRYNEAALIAALEKNGIGRPSTYAPIISIIQRRLYIEKKEGRFYPTAVGLTTNDFLVKYFSDIVNLPFTAGMENSLDKIAQGQKKWQPMLSDFWGPFSKELEKVTEKAKRVKIPVEKTGKKCPKCKKGELVIRNGRFGKFISCSRFPDCDYKAPYHEKTDFKCPQCGATVVIKTTRKGARFYSCSKWPKCPWSSWRKPK